MRIGNKMCIIPVRARPDKYLVKLALTGRGRGRMIRQNNFISRGAKMLKKEAINTEQAPRAVGPYSQALRVGDTVYVSGQLGIDPATGRLKSDDTQQQARQALTNIKAILEKAGCSMTDVAHAQVFLTDIADFGAVNEVYKEFFSEPYPARAAVAVSALPAGGKVEILVIAREKS